MVHKYKYYAFHHQRFPWGATNFTLHYDPERDRPRIKAFWKGQS